MALPLIFPGLPEVTEIGALLAYVQSLPPARGQGATLTLPGLAGLILSVGIAVDANVLIFERIREELELGKTVRLNVAAINLTKRKYWNWSDVQGLASNPTPPLLPVVDAYTQAGRHFNASLVAEF